MNPMLHALLMAEQQLPELLRSPERWQTLDITYEKPRVERVWTQWGEYRLNLHRIHPCDAGQAFFHPHPWPSAMRILSGCYEMAIGYGSGLETPPEAARLILTSESCYEMNNPDAWHYVRPLAGPVISFMVTGAPWNRNMPKSDKISLSSLTTETKEEIMEFFLKRYQIDYD